MTDELCLLGSRFEAGLQLKGNDGSRVKAEGAGVVREVGQQVRRVEEANLEKEERSVINQLSLSMT